MVFDILSLKISDGKSPMSSIFVGCYGIVVGGDSQLRQLLAYLYSHKCLLLGLGQLDLSTINSYLPTSANDCPNITVFLISVVQEHEEVSTHARELLSVGNYP